MEDPAEHRHEAVRRHSLCERIDSARLATLDGQARNGHLLLFGRFLRFGSWSTQKFGLLFVEQMPLGWNFLFLTIPIVLRLESVDFPKLNFVKLLVELRIFDNDFLVFSAQIMHIQRNRGSKI